MSKKNFHLILNCKNKLINFFNNNTYITFVYDTTNDAKYAYGNIFANIELFKYYGKCIIYTRNNFIKIIYKNGHDALNAYTNFKKESII
jgi:hypothetical protein